MGRLLSIRQLEHLREELLAIWRALEFDPEFPREAGQLGERQGIEFVKIHGLALPGRNFLGESLERCEIGETRRIRQITIDRRIARRRRLRRMLRVRLPALPASPARLPVAAATTVAPALALVTLPKTAITPATTTAILLPIAMASSLPRPPVPP